jgi:hypothetical protein
VTLVAFGSGGEAGLGGGRPDELDNVAVVGQLAAPPVDGDEAEQAVLDLVPL